MLNKLQSPDWDISRFFQFPLNTIFAKILPLSVFRVYLYILGIGYYTVNRYERFLTTQTFLNAFAHELDPHELRKEILRAFQGIFDHYYEKLVLAYRPKPKMKKYLEENCEIPNRKWLDEVSSSGKGGLVLTGHFGGIEYLPVVLSLNGYKTAIIVGFKTKRIRKATLETARYFDIFAIASDEPMAIMRCIEAIRSGRLLILPCDEFKHWTPSRKNSINIFGTIVPQDRTLDVLYRRTKAPTCLGLLAREKKKYSLKIEPLTDGKKRVSLSSQAWPLLEKYIRRYPEQWYQWNSVAKGLANYRLKEA